MHAEPFKYLIYAYIIVFQFKRNQAEFSGHTKHIIFSKEIFWIRIEIQNTDHDENVEHLKMLFN